MDSSPQLYCSRCSKFYATTQTWQFHIKLHQLVDAMEMEPVKVRVERPKTFEEVCRFAVLQDSHCVLKVGHAGPHLDSMGYTQYLFPKSLEEEIGLGGRLPDMEKATTANPSGVEQGFTPPAIQQSLHLPTEYIEGFASHVAHCSNCRDQVEKHLRFPFKMPAEDVNGRHS